MPEIAHRISITAEPARVHDLVASPEGIAAWWTGRAVVGDTAVGSRFSLCFGDSTDPAAVMQVEVDDPDRIEWRCVDGPADWRETRIGFEFRPTADGTTLLFSHAGWREQNEFLAGCSTNWGAYLTSLKHGAEGRGFGAYPAGEISRWG